MYKVYSKKLKEKKYQKVSPIDLKEVTGNLEIDLKESMKINESFIGKIKLKDLPINFRDEDEAIVWHIEEFYSNKIFSFNFTVNILAVDKMMILTNNYGHNLLKAYEENASRSQKKLVNKYVKQITTMSNIDKIIVVDNEEVLDGQHRVIAGILTNTTLFYINLREFDDL